MKRPWLDGTMTALPVIPGILFGGVLYGAAAMAADLPAWPVVATSLLVATGTAQFVALELLSQGIPWWTIVLVGLLINLRFAIYGLHLAPLAGDAPWWHRWIYFGLVTDEGYAITLSRLPAHQPASRRALAWSMVLMVAIWLPWLVGTAVGALSGARVPSGWGLELAIPLTLLNVLVLLAATPRHVHVALVAGAVGWWLRDLPWGLGLLAAMAAGLAVGMGLPRPSPSTPPNAPCTSTAPERMV